LPADPFAVGLDVALGPAAEQEFTGGKQVAFALGASVDDEQFDVHWTLAPSALAAGGMAARRSAILPYLELCVTLCPFATVRNYFFRAIATTGRGRISRRTMT